MSDKDIFEGFTFHSSIGIDFNLDGDRKFISRMPNSKQARSMFALAGNNLLVHKTSRCLWRISDDKKCIEPVFGTSVLSDEDVAAAMKEEA